MIIFENLKIVIEITVRSGALVLVKTKVKKETRFNLTVSLPPMFDKNENGFVVAVVKFATVNSV